MIIFYCNLDGNRFWKIQLDTTTNKTFNDLDSVEKSLTIQATSYALLTKMLTTSRVQEFIPISNWLIAQRNRLGGFVAAHVRNLFFAVYMFERY